MEENLKRSRVILHVDLVGNVTCQNTKLQALKSIDPTFLRARKDAFYCQVEHVRLGIPIDVPLCVQQWQGLIAVNYAARAAGIKRHCTAGEAAKMCPDVQLVHVSTYANGETEPKYHTENVTAKTHKVSLEPYRRASRKVMAIFKRFCPKFQRASIDEAYLDVTDMVNTRIASLAHVPQDDKGEPIVQWDGAGILVGEELLESSGWRDVQLRLAAEISQEIRDTVHKELSYTCSAGIAHNKTLAKLCSGMNKPNKQTIMRESQVLKHMETLPMSKIRTLGGKLGAEVESELQVEMASDLWKYSLDALKTKFGDARGVWLHNICRGICNEAVQENSVNKSMAACKNLRPSIVNDDQARHWLGILSCELFTRLQDDHEMNQRWPSTLALHSKVDMFAGGRRSKSSPMPPRHHICSPDDILAKAWTLFRCERMYPCSLIALTVSGFVQEETGSEVLTKWFGKASAGAALGDGGGHATVASHAEPTPASPPPEPHGSTGRLLDIFASPQPPGTVACPKCSQAIGQDERSQAVHADYHFALDLQRGDREGNVQRTETGQTSQGSVGIKRKQNPSNGGKSKKGKLTSFFDKAGTK
ncbi:DNA-directed DNA polymerase [Spizellomyces sp. 'palustris']|nr:DNA-directed DNA polymerase [Spizellomyces sp. 'palustris']